MLIFYIESCQLSAFTDNENANTRFLPENGYPELPKGILANVTMGSTVVPRAG